jgi:adenosylcobinamide-phosphate synthase
MVGYKTEEYKDFGWASAKFDDLVNFIPARVTALLVALISPTVQGDVSSTIEQIRAGGASLPSPNSGYPIAAFAGALGVKLCGPTSYFGVVKEKPFIGVGHRPGIMDLMNAISLYWNAYAFASAAAVALGWLVSL